MATAKPEVFVIGVGPGSPEWVSRQALAAIRKSDIIVGWEMDMAPVRTYLESKRLFLQTCGDYLQVPVLAAAEAKRSGATVAVIKTGDPLVAPAGLRELESVFAGFKMTVIPGISTVQLMVARVPVSLADCQIITYHPTPHDGGRDLRKKRRRMVAALALGRHLAVLTGVRQMPAQTADFLLGRGVNPALKCVIGERLGLEDESLTRCRLEEVAAKSFDWRSVLVVLNNRD